ncbi:MAG: hypothetical protein ACKVU2_01035 [Saprospiraceae bacterium]
MGTWPSNRQQAVSLPAKWCIGLFTVLNGCLTSQTHTAHGKKGLENVVAPVWSGWLLVFFDKRAGLAGHFLGRLGSWLQLSGQLLSNFARSFTFQW